MNYKEALFFTAKCLTLRNFPGKIPEVCNEITTGLVKWEKIVQISSGHYVFPALFIQLKQAGLLNELPPELVEYMEEFTNLNRIRNIQIMEEAAEITNLLNQHGISPIFLKGTAHLFDGLYLDVAERIISDMDFLVPEDKMVEAAEILIKNGYKPSMNYNPKNSVVTKHFPRLINANKIAAVEIHRQIMNFPFNKSIDLNNILEEKQKLNLPNNAFVLSDKYQIIHNILNTQINDFGYIYSKIFLRQSYDLLLLSQKTNPLTIAQNFGKFFNPMNANLALANLLFDNPGVITYKKNLCAKYYVSRIKFNFNHVRWARFSNVILYFFVRFYFIAYLLLNSITNKSVRLSVYARLSNPKWYGAHIRSYRKMG